MVFNEMVQEQVGEIRERMNDPQQVDALGICGVITDPPLPDNRR